MSGRWVGREQNGFRCDVLDTEQKIMGMSEARRVASLYPRAEVLHDIDVCTGEAVFRVWLPADSVVMMHNAIRRRRRNG